MKLRPAIRCALVSLALIVPAYGIAFADCNHGGYRYPEHESACRSGHQYTCEDGTWIDLSVECEDEAQAAAAGQQTDAQNAPPANN